MIVVSLLFFLLGVGLLAAGLVIESIQFELGAVVAALVAALALYAGVRQRRTIDTGSDESPGWQAPLTKPRRGRADEEPWSPPSPDEDWPSGPVAEVADAPVHDSGRSLGGAHSALFDDHPPPEPVAEPAFTDVPSARSDDLTGRTDLPAASDVSDLADAGPPDIPILDDEPAEEDVSPANVARVAARSDDVLVVDGRPRYHRRACSSLIGRDTVPIPVSEAREAGFTPCSRCRPDAHLLGSLERPTRR